MSPRLSFRILYFLFFVTLFCAISSNAQITNVTNSTSTPTPGVGHDYLGTLGETVNPANGDLSVRVNIPVPKGRGLTLPFAFTYDSNSASLAPEPSQPNQLQWQYSKEVFASGPWSYSLPQLTAIIQSYPPPGQTNAPTCFSTTGYVFHDPTGARHSLNMSAVLSNLSQTSPPGDTSCSQTPGGAWQDFFDGGNDFFRARINGIAAIGTYSNISGAGAGAGQVLVADASGTVYTFGTSSASGWNCAPGTQVQLAGNQGTIINPTAYSMPNSIEDRNGNVITISQPCAGSTSFSISDTTGRTALSFQTSGGFGTTTINSVTVSGLAQPYTVTSNTTAAGTPINVNATQVTVIATPNNCTGVPAWGAPGTGSSNANSISAITLPNGKQYQFTYDPTYGLLSKITYPGGGYVSYTWGMNPQSALVKYTDTQANVLNDCIYEYDKPAVMHRYVSFDGQTVALQQDFSYTTTWGGPNYTWSSLQTTVTTTDLIRGTSFQTVYTYSPIQVQSLPNTPLNYWDSVLPVESTTVYKDTNGQTLKTVTKSWIDAYELGCEAQTLDNGQISSVSYLYGPGHTITDKKEFDFGQTSTGCPSTTPKRETVTTYQSFANTPIFPSAPSIFDKPATVITKDSTGTRVAETDFSYDQFTVASVSNLPTGTHDETNYAATSTAPRGNATTVTRQCFQGATGCTNSVSTSTFDSTGQVLTQVDPCGNATCSDVTGTNHTTIYSYADNYDSPPASNTNAYLTQITDPLGHAQKFKYAYADGQLVSSTDQNNLVTQYVYSDPLRRITETDFPAGGKTTVSYNDNAPTPSVMTSKQINALQSVTSVALSDGLGHPIQTQLTSDPQGTVFMDTTYDGLGLVKSVSNPYRTGTDPTTTTGTTTFVYDTLGRKKNETKPDGSIITTAYCGPNTLVTDPTNRWRRSRADGLGHLVEVDEPNAVGATVAATGCPGTAEPIWTTSYSYNALNNLLQVTQNGSHQRTFTYDSLARMLTSSNPEVGTLTYTYDANGNVSTKQDARAITATYGYDVVNRLLAVSHSNGDPGATFTYDQSNCLGLATCQNIGERTSAIDAAGSEAWSYQVDASNLRSIHVNQRTTGGITKTSTYFFDLAANITQIVYPTGRVVNYAYDSANRPKTAVDGSNGITYATDFQTAPAGCLAGAVCYTPQGSFYALSIGQTTSFSGLNITHTYNHLLQPLEFKASSTGGNAIDITYSFADPLNGNHNAGHVFAIANNLDGTRSQNFGYDQLNRISSAQTTSTFATGPSNCWGENYNVDPWGNLQSITATTNTAYNGCTQESGFSTTADSNNHLSIFGYDLSGNTSSDGFVTNYAWDAESQLKSVAGVTYTYDGEGRRVSKVGSRLYWYGSGGNILAETDASGNTTAEYIFFGSNRVAMVAGAQSLPGTGSATISGSEQSIAGAPATSGTGSVTFSGNLQSKQVLSQAAASGTGSVTFSGSLQSKQVQTQAATPGTGTVTVSGAERSKTFPAGCTPRWDGGIITVYVNGTSVASVNYGDNSTGCGTPSPMPTASSLATQIASAINSSSLVSATASGATITITSKTSGANTNYSLSTQVTSYFVQAGFPPASFSLSTSGSTLTGGADAVYGTRYDSGTSTITVNGHSDSVSWSGSSTTTTSIASALASNINADSGASVTAVASGSTVNLTAKTSGASTNYSLGSSWTYDSADFSSSSFTSSNSGSTLIGGRDATYNTIYDSGTSTITVNGHGTSYSWSGSGTTTSSIASGLAASINSDSAASVTASSSASTVNLTAKSTGASTNYSLASSSTYDSADFSSASFASSNSGSALTGGHDTGATTYDSGTVWITINGTQYSVSYGQGSSSSSVAGALASVISAGSFANASASGSSISITAKTNGVATNYSLSSGSSTSQGSFSSPSFTTSTSGSTLTGGRDSIFYYAEDQLGTSRVLTTDTGVVCYDADFYPFGGERAYTNTCSQNYKFEGKERDTETGNDDFGARYYSNRFGRWLSADWSNVPTPVPYANLANPQTLNLYAMVSDDPESFVDLDGHFLNFGRSASVFYQSDCWGDADWSCLTQTASSTPSQQEAQQQQNQTAQSAQNAPSTAGSVAAGVGKELKNQSRDSYIVTAVTTGNIPIAILIAAFTDESKASNSTEKSAMRGTFIALLFVPGGGEEAAGTKASAKGTAIATSKLAGLIEAAEKQYPKLAGKIDKHHIIPIYLGGAKNGERAAISKAYHQMITNEFRKLWPYGGPVPTAEQLSEILKAVYSKFPL